MTATDRNPAAFPRGYSEQQPGDRREFNYAQQGMTLREWYAGQALAGLVQFADAPTALKPHEMAEAAFRIADAMLAEAVK